MGVLVVGEVIERGGGAVVVIVAVVAVVVVVVAVVGGGRKDYIEAGWGGETREGTVGVEIERVGAGGPTIEIEEDRRMGKFADHGQNRKRRWKSGVVAGQGA